MSFSKYFSTLALIFGIFATFQAQAQIGVGFRGGVLMSNQTVKLIADGQEEQIESENITGYVVGIPVELGLSKFFALQSEVNYMKQGYGTPENPAQNLPESKVSYDVLEVPVLAKIGWISEKFSFAAVFGPSFQYLAGGRVELSALTTDLISIQASQTDIDFSQDVYEEVTRTNFYGQIGGQLGLPFAGGKFVFDGRYRFALNDQDSNDDFEVKGRGVSATLGYMLTLGNY